MAGKKGMHVKALHPIKLEQMRAKIKSTLIINRLENHILNDIEMTASQVSAALGLLKKAVPDLSSVEIAGNEDKPLLHAFKWMD